MNNNNNDAIDSFHFRDSTIKPVTFQPLWTALLDSGVRKIRFGNNCDADPSINYNNIKLDFTDMETNTSLKELDLGEYNMREDDYRNLFHSMKKNKGLERLKLKYYTYQYLSTQMKTLFEEMICESTTLLDCRFYRPGRPRNERDPVFQMIQFQMKLNRMWKRYIIMKHEREKKERTVLTRSSRVVYNCKILKYIL